MIAALHREKLCGEIAPGTTRAQKSRTVPSIPSTALHNATLSSSSSNNKAQRRKMVHALQGHGAQLKKKKNSSMEDRACGKIHTKDSRLRIRHCSFLA